MSYYTCPDLMDPNSKRNVYIRSYVRPIAARIKELKVLRQLGKISQKDARIEEVSLRNHLDHVNLIILQEESTQKASQELDSIVGYTP